VCIMSTIGQNTFSDIFPKRLGIFSPNFTCLLNVPIYAGLQIFIQLSATLTKLCHIKCDHHNVQCSKCPPSTATHVGWSHLIWHYFVTVGDNWTKICILAYVRMYNSQPFWKNAASQQGGIFFDSHCISFLVSSLLIWLWWSW